MREVKVVGHRCMVCDGSVNVAMLDSPDPEAPTMFQALHTESQSVWFGTYIDDGGDLRMLICCSDSCAQKFLEE